MRRLSGMDAAFLYLETPTTHMHVHAVMMLDPSTVPGGYSFEKIKAHLASRLPDLLEFRRRLAYVPFGLHRPVWFDDPDFDFDYHVRRIAVPSPGSREQVAEIVGDIASRPLDHARPLWEFYVIEGVENGAVAVVARMHHATIDGVSGSSLLTTILDLEPEPVDATPATDDWKPEHKPSDMELLQHAIMSRLRRPLPLALALAMPNLLRAAVGVVRVRRDSSRPSGGTPFNTPRTPWNAPLTPHRRVAFATVPLDEVKAIKDAFGCTVNDIVLATATRALRHYLLGVDALPDRPLLAACPVSVRNDETADIDSANKVSAMFVSLPTHLDDVHEQVAHIRDATKGAKQEHHAVGARTLLDLGELAGPRSFGLASRLLGGLASRGPVPINLVISNVPGPPFPLYLGGARLISLLPLGPPIEGAGLNITVLSYLDRIDWGFIACRELVPGLQDMAHAVEDAHHDLMKAAKQQV
ncbi:MAG: diacylglycerol O-acyltransferase / wax synthase [Actinomycetota bacterium]|nr:diacylglycerol O-acyltransferase / wax synthase [Actinomycetota bacterium]